MSNNEWIIIKILCRKSIIKYIVKDWLWWRWQMLVKIGMAAVTPPGASCGGGIRLSENYVHWAPLNMIERVLSENPWDTKEREGEMDCFWFVRAHYGHNATWDSNDSNDSPTMAALWLMTTRPGAQWGSGHQRLTSLSRGLGVWIIKRGIQPK